MPRKTSKPGHEGTRSTTTTNQPELHGIAADDAPRKRRRQKIEDAAYDVGFGKPPPTNRFPPGVSGNPKGRPRGSRSLSALLERELGSKVTVREGGREIRISKFELVAKQLVNKAAAGDPRALKAIASLTPATMTAEQPETPEVRTESLSATEKGLLQDHLAYLDLKRGGDPLDE